MFSWVRLFVILWTVGCSPPGSSVGFSRQEYWGATPPPYHLSTSSLVLLHIYPLAGLQCCSTFQMDKPRWVEFRKVTYLVTAGRGAELLRRLGPFLASISSFRGLLWDSLCPGREREWWLSSVQSHFTCSLNVLRGGLKNIGLIV